MTYAPTFLHCSGMREVTSQALQDLVAIAETGSGKTCAYLLPVMARIAKWGPKQVVMQGAGKDDRPPAQPHALVMAPTRELVQQICMEAQKFSDGSSVRAMGIYGGVPKGEQVSGLKSGVDLLVATPGRLRDFMTGDPKKGAAPVVIVEAVTYVVLDEADRMLDMGFEPEIRWIVAQCPAGGDCQDVLAGNARQTLFFTATWPKDVRKSASHLTRSAVQIQVGQGVGRLATNTKIKQMVRLVCEEDKLLELKRVLASQLQPGETALVFAGRKGTCDALQQEPQGCSCQVPAQSSGFGRCWQELTWDPLKPDAPVCAWCRALHGDKDRPEREGERMCSDLETRARAG